jgi:hypothetical protein
MLLIKTGLGESGPKCKVFSEIAAQSGVLIRQRSVAKPANTDSANMKRVVYEMYTNCKVLPEHFFECQVTVS